MAEFSRAQLEYLGEGRLARLATIGSDGVPHVTPVGMWTYDPTHGSIDISGNNFDQTKKFRDVRATGRAAIVIDDMASLEPRRPRGIEVRGTAEAVSGEHPLIRIHPDRIVAWGLE